MELVEQGDLSRKEFCARTGLKEYSFHYWRKKYRNRPESESKFLPISAEEQSTEGYQVEIEFRNGVKLRFSSLVSAEYLSQILRQG
jgi:hypothetical protein